MSNYRVTGALSVLGYAPGETFDADLPEDQEARMIERGSLEIVGQEADQTSAPAEAPESEDAENADPDAHPVD